MNMISELRQRVRQNGKAEITPEEFDQLQAEWIMRAGSGKLILAEREACEELRAQACRARNLIECGDTAAALNCLCDAIENTTRSNV